jgi:hypothetical protein
LISVELESNTTLTTEGPFGVKAKSIPTNTFSGYTFIDIYRDKNVY